MMSTSPWGELMWMLLTSILPSGDSVILSLKERPIASTLEFTTSVFSSHFAEPLTSAPCAVKVMAKTDVLQGTLDLMVLKTVAAMGPMHGYAIAARLEQVSNGALQLNMLKRWLEWYPDKITFGTDAFPYGEALGVEEAYWLGVHTARTALAAALAEMIAAREIPEARAVAFARAYLHDTAAGLYR